MLTTSVSSGKLTAASERQGGSLEMQVRRLAVAATFTAAGLLLTQATVTGSQGNSAPQSGSLEVCKVAGAGVAAGDPFTFSLTTQKVTRMITVTAGSCTTVIVGTRADARSQGFFASHPTDVTVLIGSGVTLKVNSVQLSAAQVQTIMDATSGNPNGVSASSNVLLTLVQQLITAALNILEGVVAPPTVLAALGQANAAIQVSVSGTSTAVTTSLSKAQLSALVETLTAFNEGRSGTPGNGTASVGVVEGGGTATTVIAIVCNPA